MKTKHAEILLILALCLTSRLDSAHAAALETQGGLSRAVASTVEGRHNKGYSQPVDKLVTLWKNHAKQVVSLTWNAKQYKAFKKIIYKESRWIPNQTNPATNAYGLGQIINSKRYTKNMPYKQINAAVKYILNRYGTPTKALAHHKKHGWY